MTFDIKNNNYLLSFLAGLIGTAVYFMISKVSEDENKKEKVDYLVYAKLLILISAVVLCVLLYVRSEGKKLEPSKVTNDLIGGGNNSVSSNVGLQEINMNQKIHTGNPEF